MDYKKIYENLIDKAKNRKELLEIRERHHIVPKSLGGSNKRDNIVLLSPREHFIAHLLLSRFGGYKMKRALFLMSTRNGYTSGKYAKLREEYVLSIKGDKERGRRISNTLRGKRKSEEHIRNWIDSRKRGDNWKCPNHKKEAQRITMKGQGNPMYGKTHNSEARKKISEANKQRINCPHCDKIGGIAIMKRWHFNNCKNLKDRPEI